MTTPATDPPTDQPKPCGCLESIRKQLKEHHGVTEIDFELKHFIQY